MTSPSVPQNQEPKRPACAATVAESALLLVGSMGPLGYAPASGTVTVAVAGIPLVYLMASHLAPVSYAMVTVGFAVCSVAIHHFGDRILGESDSRRLVWDELAGFFVAMFLVTPTVKTLAVAFVLERFMDIVKVPPANLVDRRMHSGLGVVLDDVIAGAYTCALMHGLIYLAPSLAL